jgi:hypothetical protein
VSAITQRAHAVYDPDTEQARSWITPCRALAMFRPSLSQLITANPLGVKGAGKAGAVGAPPAVINAIVDALQRRVGLRHIDMPATPRRVWGMLNGI